ncbi:MAG TPA: DUF5916 domain-containing protein [Longimicrobiales bacterium]
MLLTLAAALQLALPPAAPPERAVYHGRLDETTVTVPKRAAEARIDGRLDEPAWNDAVLLTSFSQYSPVDGAAAEDSTEVFVWYSDHEIYFGIRAFEPHGVVNATLADRDKFFSNDFVVLYLDTFNDRRRAFIFGVNPFGVQADGVFTENPSQNEDYTPDYIYQSKGRLTDFGYEVELRIPFKSIPYQPARVQDWGIQIVRRVQHSGQDQTWTQARRGAASFLAQNGSMVGLTDLKRGLVLDVNPVATARLQGTRTSSTEFAYGSADPEFGGNLRWGVTANLTLNATANPDFSQIESDAAQTVFDPRQSLFFAEKRPFFLENTEQLSAPSQLIYTRRIVSPVGAVKLTGKTGATNIGFLSAVDDAPQSASGADHPVYNILRLRRDIGQQSAVGVVYTDKEVGADFNRVAGLDARVVFAREYSLFAQVAGSFWQNGAADARAPLWALRVNRNGRSFGWNINFDGVHPDFVAAAGFIQRPGIAHSNTGLRFTRFGRPGDLVQSYSFNPLIDNTWDYDEFAHGVGPDDIKLHLNNSFTLRGGWRAALQLFIESFRYPDQLYGNYYMLHREANGDSSFVKFTGVNRIPNFDAMITVNTPQFDRWSAGGFVVAGRDENFDEWAPGYIMFSQLNASYRPTDKVRADLSYIEQRTVRPSDRSVVNLQRIPRLKVEYQVSRPIFVRFVGQYVSLQRAALRDDGRSNDPIYLYGASSNSFTRAGAFASNSFRADWLFSYQPTPGTVIFAGYGSSLRDVAAFAFRDVSRTSDGFFVKLSYLLRL